MRRNTAISCENVENQTTVDFNLSKDGTELNDFQKGCCHMSNFQQLADHIGIILPAMLANWLEDGSTRYDNWAETWRERMLNSPPPLISTYDFEWISAENARGIQTDWLNPKYQQGIRFLPFACTGAGDCYALVPLAKDTLPVALITHDSGRVTWYAASFAEFAYLLLLEACADNEHLLEDGFLEAEADQCLLADMSNVAKVLPRELADRLQKVITCLAAVNLNYSDSEDQEAAAFAASLDLTLALESTLSEQRQKIYTADFPELTCKPRWECE